MFNSESWTGPKIGNKIRMFTHTPFSQHRTGSFRHCHRQETINKRHVVCKGRNKTAPIVDGMTACVRNPRVSTKYS